MESNAIAVIGMAGRFPGAKDVRAFWRNLAAGVEAVHYFTDDELRAAGEAEQAISDPAYVKACGRLEDVEMFDAAFFGISPRDAAIFDPQHRIFLECAWEALEYAGYVGEAIEGSVGVFASCGMSEYMMKNVMTNPEVMATVGEWLVRHTANDTNFLATRVSYELNLRGPSVNVQSGCSSTLVAIHFACQSLLNGECDLALAGGATIYAEQNKGYFKREGEILSADGHTRSFDANATGTTMSNAVGCVVLKRLADAERDGDNVLAIVRGSAINNDGHDKVGYLAPSVSGQARAVTEALGIAGVSAEEISYVEAHGTATRIGDPIEIAGLTQAFRAFTDKTGYCAIGSLKSAIGHTGEASGVAAFVKTVLALQNRQIPPSLHFESPNPECRFSSSPFFVNTKLRPWEAARRIAGITSLGVGGTNCHVILEQGPVPPEPAAAPSREHQVLVVSAKTEGALDAATQNLARHLEEDAGASLADIAFTLTAGRKGFRHRRAIVAKDAVDAARAIATMDARRVSTGKTDGEPRSVAFLFPDADALYLGMGRDLYRSERAFKEALDATIASLPECSRSELLALIAADPGRTEEAELAASKLEQPSLALPALFAIEYAMAELLASWGVAPTAAIGHGAGEYAAACVAGVLSPEDAIALATTRGRLFESGARERLPAGVAVHAAVLEPMLAEFAAFCRTIRFGKPRIPFVSSHTGAWITEARARDARYWVDQLRATVPFADGLRTLLQDRERVLVEVGPGRTLSIVAMQQARRRTAIATMRPPNEEISDDAFLLAAMGRMWTVGAVELSALFDGQARRRVPLPTYPWQRQRYWIAPGAPASDTRGATASADAPSSRSGQARLPAFERPEISASFVAPRSPLEHELAVMWRELLGVERVGVHDDFFELGGQSVVAVQFFSRIRKKYGVDLPLSTLFDASCIERFAAALSDALGAERGAMAGEASGQAEGGASASAGEARHVSNGGAHREFQSLVAVQRGDGHRPFFCVHGAGGNVLNFRDLSRSLPAHQPLYGLQARGVDGILRPHRTIEEMADAYLDEIRALQPRGPYMLGGYSGGGLVAFEIARRITEAGDAVDLLALIDTLHPNVPIRKMTMAKRLARARGEGPSYVRRVVEGRLTRRRTRRSLEEAARLVAAGEPIPPELREAYLVRSFEEAVARYRPCPWTGSAILFRAEEVEYIYRDAGPAYGWEGTIAHLTIARVPGNHDNVLLGGSGLVDALGRAIEEARTGARAHHVRTVHGAAAAASF